MNSIERARTEFERDSPFWTYRFASGLEQIRPDLPVEWALRCVARLLPESGSPAREQLQTDFENLVSWVHSDNSTTPYIEIAREIWYRPGDDAAKKAISHLYGAYDLYRKGDRGYLHAVGTPIQNFLLEGSTWQARRDKLFSVAIEAYDQLVAENVEE